MKANKKVLFKYFPVPAKRTPSGKPSMEGKDLNPYRKITSWFDQGGNLNILTDITDKERYKLLDQVTGLSEMVTGQYPNLPKNEQYLMMEFILHGLSAYSLISKKILEGKIEFNDLIGSMMDFGDIDVEDE